MTYRAETTANGTSARGLRVEATITCHHHHLTAARAASCARRQEQEMRRIAGRKRPLDYTLTAISRRSGQRTPITTH